jgi:hypothetical protein
MAILSSQLFASDDKLKDTAQFDKDHLGEQFNPTHPSVKKIQEALQKVMGVDLSSEAGRFGSKTGDAVANFKRTRKEPILNFAGQIDRVVGIKTIKALDGLLPVGPGPVPPVPPVPVATKTSIDFVINYKGGGGAPNLNKPLALFGLQIDTYKAKPNRQLQAIGRGGSFLDVNGDLTDVTPMNEDFQTIKKALAAPDVQVGAICIHGSSSGGKAALKLASLLAADKIPVRFIGIEDGAFLHRDASNTPIPTGIPIPGLPFLAANSPNIKALFTVDPNATKHNFWQDRQNRGQLGRAGLFWTSNLAGEIHGKLQSSMGFQDIEIKTTTNEPHGDAVQQAEKRNVGTISKLLNDL